MHHRKNIKTQTLLTNIKKWAAITLLFSVSKQTVRTGICHIFPIDSRGSRGSFNVVTTAHVHGAHTARCTILRVICLCTLSSICLMEHCRGGRWRHFLAAPRQPHRWDNCVRTTLLDPCGMVSHCMAETGRIQQIDVQTRQGMTAEGGFDTRFGHIILSPPVRFCQICRSPT